MRYSSFLLLAGLILLSARPLTAQTTFGNLSRPLSCQIWFLKLCDTL